MTLYDLGKSDSRQRLRGIEVPKFKGKSKHKTTQLGLLADTIIKSLHDADLKVLREDWKTAVNDNVLFGSIDVKPGSMQGPDLDEIGSFVLSVRTANNNKYALTFLSGARIDKAGDDNYFCFGDPAARVRNSVYMNLEETCEEAVHHFIQTADKIQGAVDQLKATPVTEDTASFIVLRTAEKDLMPYRSIEYVWKDWAKDTDNSAWRLWQSFKPAYVKLGPADRFEMSKGLYPLFCSVLGVGK